MMYVLHQCAIDRPSPRWALCSGCERTFSATTAHSLRRLLTAHAIICHPLPMGRYCPTVMVASSRKALSAKLTDHRHMGGCGMAHLLFVDVGTVM